METNGYPNHFLIDGFPGTVFTQPDFEKNVEAFQSAAGEEHSENSPLKYGEKIFKFRLF